MKPSALRFAQRSPSTGLMAFARISVLFYMALIINGLILRYGCQGRAEDRFGLSGGLFRAVRSIALDGLKLSSGRPKAILRALRRILLACSRHSYGRSEADGRAFRRCFPAVSEDSDEGENREFLLTRRTAMPMTEWAGRWLTRALRRRGEASEEGGGGPCDF